MKQAKPTLDDDGVFGDPNAFIEAVFTDLSRVAKPASSKESTAGR